MHIAEVLHDLIEHTTAYLSAENRESAHQAVDDTYPDHDDHNADTEAEPVEAPAPDPKARIAELEAELEQLRGQQDTGT